MKRSLLDALQARRAQGRPVALVTDLTNGLQSLVTRDGVAGDMGLEVDLVQTVRRRLHSGRSGMETDPLGVPHFVTVYPAPWRLLVIGAVHLAQSLARMALAADYAVFVIDPRDTFATAARFPGVTLVTEPPGEAVAALAPDARTAVVGLSHDPEMDDPGLQVALDSPAFYIGALGSRKTHDKRCRRLRDRGVSAAALDRLYGPIGLPLGDTAGGGRSLGEIAVAILAQMTMIRRQENDRKAAKENENQDQDQADKYGPACL